MRHRLLALAACVGIMAPIACHRLPSALATGPVPACGGWRCPPSPGPPGPPGGGGGQDGKLIASTISITVNGGRRDPGHGGRHYGVASPCGYITLLSGPEMAATFPNGDGFVTAAEVVSHAHDNKGYWYEAECQLPFANTPPGLGYVNDKLAHHTFEVFSDPAQPPRPPVAVPILVAVASDQAEQQLPIPPAQHGAEPASRSAAAHLDLAGSR